MAAPTPTDLSPVYISGPMFSAADLWQQSQIATVLESYNPPFTTYLPQRDGIEVGPLMASVNQVNTSQVLPVIYFIRQIVFCMDMYQLLGPCKSLVFNMDGRVPDEGSVSETASAFVAGKPIVIYKTTPITMLGGEDNPMLSGLSMNWQTVGFPPTSVNDLPAALLAAGLAVQQAGFTPFQPGGQVSAVMKLGGMVWENINNIHGIIKSVNPQDPGTVIAAMEAFLALQGAWLPYITAAFPDAPVLQAPVFPPVTKKP
jgi:hypothetical protein